MRVTSLAEWHMGILFEGGGCQLGALWGEGAPLGALWGWGSGVVKNFSPMKMSTFPPASISDLVSPGIVGCLGSVI